MATSVAASEKRAGRQQGAASSDHVIWGGLENSSSDLSSSDNNSAHRSFGREKKGILERTEGIEMLSESGTDTNSVGNSDGTSKSREALAKFGEEAARVTAAAASSSAAAPAASVPEEDEDEPQEGEGVAQGPPPSVGSTGHGSGSCKPCLFLYETIGCQDGASCSFCHYPHNRRRGARQSKGKRDRFRKLVNKVEAAGNDPEQERQPVAVGRVVREDGPRKNLMSL